MVFYCNNNLLMHKHRYEKSNIMTNQGLLLQYCVKVPAKSGEKLTPQLDTQHEKEKSKDFFSFLLCHIKGGLKSHNQ
eukprot:UN02427